MTGKNIPRKIPGFAKALMRFQAFLLRRNWMGALGEELMVITVTGQKTGRTYSTPVGYLRDGNTIVALSTHGGSHWYHNALAAGQAKLEIKGQAVNARAEAITDEAERRRIFELYKRERAKNFARLFGVPVDAPAEALEQALALRVFVRFTPQGE